MSLAARGARNLDDGIEAINDKDVRDQLQRQARRVYLKAVLAAAAVTLLCLAIPI